LAQAVRNSNASLVTGALIERLLVAPDGKRIDGVAYRQGGKRHELYAGMVAAGAVNSAACCYARPAIHAQTASRTTRGVVGRYFMNHNCTARPFSLPRAIDIGSYELIKPRRATTFTILPALQKPLGGANSLERRRAASPASSSRSPCSAMTAADSRNGQGRLMEQITKNNTDLLNWYTLIL